MQLEKLLEKTKYVWGEDVSNPDMLEAVKTAVRVNRSIKRIRIEGSDLRWANVATAVIEGAEHNTTLMEVKLEIPYIYHPPIRVIAQARHTNPKLQLVVEACEYTCTCHHMTSYDITR